MRLPVRFRLPRRQVFLFLIAILVPCGVLVAFGIQMMAQERQLESKRIADEKQRLLDQARQELLSGLEQIKLQQATHSGTGIRIRPERGVVFAGRISGGELQLPWENTPESRQFGRLLSDGPFASQIHAGETQELIQHQYEDAVTQYRAAVQAATDPAQQTYGRLLLARTLAKWGRKEESRTEYAGVIRAAPDIVDEEDIPLGLYAAPALLEQTNQQSRISDWIRLAADEQRMLPPAALRIAHDLALHLGAADAALRLAGLIRDREQAEGLQRDLARLMPAFQDRGPIWVGYGDPVWLASITHPASGDGGLLVAVDAGQAVQQLRTPGIRVSTAAETTGQTLGDNFPGFRIVTPEPEVQKIGFRQRFFVAAVSLALFFTLLAGYLLWRDVQRDLRTAAMRSRFVSSVTHELKTPLTAIRMFTETLRLDEEVDVRTRNDYLDTILNEAERLSRLVDNVLDFGKIERGRKTYHFEALKLDEVIHQAARAARYPLEQAGFTLEIHTEDGMPPVRADSDALQQAILNLLTNAMKYSGDSRRIALRLDRTNGNARISVEDHGIGIEAAEQQRIFDRFYRAPIAENQHIPGTGLGLTIVAHIAKAHGGRVEVTSRPGDGSSFSVYLPVEVSA